MHGAHDLPADLGQAQLGRQVAQRHGRRLAVVTAHLVGMRGAQFTLQLPDQVGQFAARCQARQQRCVSRTHGRPIHARHVVDPEVVTLQAPDLGKDLCPFLRWVHGQVQARQVDEARTARSFVAFGRGLGFIVGLAGGVDGAQPVAGTQQQRMAVGRHHEAIDLRRQGLGFAGGEVKHLQHAWAFLVAASTVRADNGLRGPDHLAAGHPRDLAVAAFGHRKGRHAARQAFGLQRGQCRRRRGALSIPILVAILQPPWRWLEGRNATGLQGQQVGPSGARKAQLELHAVVDRVKGAQRQEVQVLAAGAEGRAVVAKLGLRGQHALPAGRVHQLDGGMAAAGGQGAGQPLAAGRPGWVFDAAELAVRHALQCATGHIAHPQLVAVVGDGQLRALRRGTHGGDAAQGPGQNPRAASLQDLDLLFTAGVAGQHQGLPVGQPLGQSAARRALTVLVHGAFPQGHAEDLAAGLQHQAVAGGVQGQALQMLGGRHEPARSLGAAAGRLDVELACAVVGRVVQPQLGCTLIDDALAVGGCMPRVVVGVVGVAAQCTSVGCAGVQVGNAFGIAQEVQALAQPHGRAEVALQLELAEAAAAAVFHPQLAHAAAAVALPARRVSGVAADGAPATRAIGQVVHLAQWQAFGLRAGLRLVQGVAMPVAKERLAMVAAELDMAVGREAAHCQVTAQPGDASCRAASGGHQPDLGMLLVAPGVGQPLAAGRQAGRARLRQTGREALCHAAMHAGTPQVVVADENHGVALQRGLAKVGGRSRVHGHGCDMGSGHHPMQGSRAAPMASP